MTFFTASFETVVLRFALMMATIIGTFVGGVPFLALLALPIFLSAMTGVSFTTQKQEKIAQMKATKYNTKISKQASLGCLLNSFLIRNSKDSIKLKNLVLFFINNL